jgi:hypothetical protein
MYHVNWRSPKYNCTETHCDSQTVLRWHQVLQYSLEIPRKILRLNHYLDNLSAAQLYVCVSAIKAETYVGGRLTGGHNVVAKLKAIREEF